MMPYTEKSLIIEFKKISVRPLSANDVLIGLKLVFSYEYVSSGDSYDIEFDLNFSKLRKCVIVQSVDLMKMSHPPQNDWTYCEIKSDSNYYLYKTLERLAKMKDQN